MAQIIKFRYKPNKVYAKQKHDFQHALAYKSGRQFINKPKEIYKHFNGFSWLLSSN